MAQIVITGDLTAGLDAATPPTVIPVPVPSTVVVNGKLPVLLGHLFAPHAIGSVAAHTPAVIVTGCSKTVFINGTAIYLAGGLLSCGDSVVIGKSTVFVEL